MGSKRAQVTVYIIIGIVVLASVSIFLYIRSAKVEAPVTFKPTIEEIPADAEPLRQFVTSCLRDTAEEALKRVGDYGGYASLEDMDADINRFSPTEGDAVLMSPDSSLAVPYWWYLKSSNDCLDRGQCIFASKRPNLYSTQGEPSIEGNLQRYINSHISDCTAGFADFAKEGISVAEKGIPSTKAVVTNDDVAFELTYPITASAGSAEYSISKYFVEVPVNLREIYELSSQISEFQENYSIIEQHTRNLISLYSRVDPDALPPFAASDVQFSQGVTWIKSSVQEKLTQMLVSNIPLLSVTNTRSFRPRVPPVSSDYRVSQMTIYNNNMIIPVTKKAYPSLDVSFSYLDWWDPVYFDLNCEGQICKPQAAQVAGLMIRIGLQRYVFNYDVSFPVLVEVTSPYALNGRGYSFKFFLESNIRKNKPLPEAIEDLGELFEPPSRPVGTMLCDSNKRLSPEITIQASDNYIGGDVEGADISFSCGGTETCRIGTTGKDGKISAKFPVCLGGKLSAKKDGYVSSSTLLSTSAERPFDVEIMMNPIIKRNVEIRKLEYRKQCLPIYIETAGDEKEVIVCNWSLNEEQGSQRLSGTEEALVTIKRKGMPGDQQFTATSSFFGDRTVDEFSDGISIAPGYYDIEVYIINRDKIIIPPRKECEGGGLFSSPECFTIPLVEFNETSPYMSGGAKLSDVLVSSADLANSDTIVFYGITYEIDNAPLDIRVVEDIDLASNMDIYSDMHADLLEPGFERRSASRQAQEVTLGE